jgi:N-glycosylase/DNA lyase
MAVIYSSKMPFSPMQIANSGQCFRMRQIDTNRYLVIANREQLLLQELGENRFSFYCDETRFTQFWKGYFDLETDYTQYTSKLPSEDQYMQQAIAAGTGLRILRQDPWEMLITFLLSQRKAIPLIKRSIELLCEAFGDEIAEAVYAFPTPEQLATATEDQLAACGLGYRTKYVMAAAEQVASGTLDLDALSALSDAELKQRLLELYGVGVKVASCVMLFGFHRLDSVPVDVWMERVAKEHYDGKFPYTGAGSYGGVLQQYVFEYIRSTYPMRQQVKS